MIGYLKGEFTKKAATYVYMDVGGVGYHVNISLHTFSELDEKLSGKLYTHLMVKEDSHTLYGFHTEEERDLFVMLISVSGIGGNTARVILSYMSPKEVKAAILQENVVAFKNVKGIGPKTAKRIILDLKDKVAKITDDVRAVEQAGNAHNNRDAALSALQSLGFQRAAVEKKIAEVMKVGGGAMELEEIIKQVLKQLS